MALQIYTQPRADQYVLAGAQGLGRGIESGGASIGSALATIIARAQEAERLRETLRSLNQPQPQPPSDNPNQPPPGPSQNPAQPSPGGGTPPPDNYDPPTDAGASAPSSGSGGSVSGAGSAGQPDYSDLADKAKRYRNALGALHPDHKDVYQTMSLPQLQGRMDAISLNRAGQIAQSQRAKLDEEVTKLRTDRMNAALQGQFMQQLAGNLRGQAPQSYDAALQNPSGTPGMDPLSAMATAAAGSGYNVPAGQLDDIIRAAAAAQGKTPNALTFGEDPITGSRYAQFGRSILPSGVNPQKAMQAADQMPETPKGYTRVWNGKSWMFLKTPEDVTDGELTPATLNGQPVAGMVVDKKGNIKDLLGSQLGGMVRMPSLTNAPAASAVATHPPGTVRIVIQNGWRYALDKDGKATAIGPAQ